MKKNFRSLGVILAFITSLFFLSCLLPEEEQLPTSKDLSFNGKICNGKKILSFATMGALQQAHLNLYNQYQLSNEDEQVLVDYEISNNFYSLRKKEQNMEEGIIPDDPTFDETNFTFDPVFETLLNEDGMIIIGQRLYLWDSGCVIHSIPFSCANYQKLLSFYHAVKNNATDAMHSIFIENNMTNINTCDDASYDFESVSENGGRVEGQKPRVKNKNGCGYEVVLNNQLISCDGGFNTYTISFEGIAPIGAGDPLNVFTLSGSAGNLDGLQIQIGIGGPWVDIDDSLTYLPVPGTGFGNTFNIRIPDGLTNSYYMELTSVIGLLGGNSCMASNNITIDNTCPFSIVAINNYVNESDSSWTFSIPSTPQCVIGGSKVTWNFGDGTGDIVGGFSMTHVYSACKKETATVTAIVEGPVCGTTNKLFTKGGIPYGNGCMYENYTFDTHKETVDGKKVKLRAKIKRNNMTQKSIFKNVFKWRVNGSKTIQSLGVIHSPSANNTSCLQSNISSVMPDKTTNGKKRNRQKEKFPTIYLINAQNPYQVKFTHSGGYNHTLVANGIMCQ